jgi:hypothetical protein
MNPFSRLGLAFGLSLGLLAVSPTVVLADGATPAAAPAPGAKGKIDELFGEPIPIAESVDLLAIARAEIKFWEKNVADPAFKSTVQACYQVSDVELATRISVTKSAISVVTGMIQDQDALVSAAVGSASCKSPALGSSLASVCAAAVLAGAADDAAEMARKKAVDDRDLQKKADARVLVAQTTAATAQKAAADDPKNQSKQATSAAAVAAVLAAMTEAGIAKTTADASDAAATKAKSTAVVAAAALRTARDAAVAQQREAEKSALRNLQSAGARLFAQANPSPADFEVFSRDAPRRTKCAALIEEYYAIYAPEKGKVAAREATDQAAADHSTDVLRKALTLVTGITSGNSTVENPGSPDHVVFSVMSGLGAEKRTNGNQLVLTLNLASLFVPADKSRLELSPFMRNIFVRAMVPLGATDSVLSATGASADPTKSSAATAGDAGRFSMMLGGSLFDESDTRLPSSLECYGAVITYKPLLEAASNSDARRERFAYYDICARIVANKSRLAWRTALGFITDKQGSADAKTRAELAAAALVWAPTSQIYFNAFFQRAFAPTTASTLGAGFSLAGNAGGVASGVNAWGRIGVDTIFTISQINDAWHWQARIAPTFRARIADSAIATFSIGPKIVGDDVSHPELLSTVALTYDADALIEQFLTTPAAPAAK